MLAMNIAPKMKRPSSIMTSMLTDLSLSFLRIFVEITMFMAKANLKIDISINKHVCGLAWLQGTLEK